MKVTVGLFIKTYLRAFFRYYIAFAFVAGSVALIYTKGDEQKAKALSWAIMLPLPLVVFGFIAFYRSRKSKNELRPSSPAYSRGHAVEVGHEVGRPSSVR